MRSDSLSKKVIVAEHAPAAIGPYSHAIAVGDLLFTSGQIPLVPETGKIVADSIEEQTIGFEKFGICFERQWYDI